MHRSSPFTQAKTRADRGNAGRESREWDGFLLNRRPPAGGPLTQGRGGRIGGRTSAAEFGCRVRTISRLDWRLWGRPDLRNARRGADRTGCYCDRRASRSRTSAVRCSSCSMWRRALASSANNQRRPGWAVGSQSYRCGISVSSMGCKDSECSSIALTLNSRLACIHSSFGDRTLALNRRYELQMTPRTWNRCPPCSFSSQASGTWQIRPPNR